MPSIPVITEIKHSRVLARVCRAAFIGSAFCIGTYSLSWQNTSTSTEMQATIQTYWPRSQYTLRADSNLVEVGVVVRDTRGRTIGALSKGDFEIEDAGKKREITTFSVETFAPMLARPIAAKSPDPAPVAANLGPSGPPPRYVALLFDDLSMPFADQPNVKAATRRFLKEDLAPGDRVGLFTTSGKQLVPFTDDVVKLVQAIDRYNSFPRVPDGGICPKLTAYDAYVIANKIDYETFAIKQNEFVRCSQPNRRTQTGQVPIVNPNRGGSWPFPGTNAVIMQAEAMWTQIRDTSLRALENTGNVVDFLARFPGTKMVLLASSGFLVGTLEVEHQKVIDHALRGEVVINALDARGLYADDPPEVTRGADEYSIRHMVDLGSKPKDLNKDVMSILARSTGGLFFENNNDLDLGFRELGMVPEVSYRLGFSPEEAPNGKYHDLKVRLRSNKHYLIQARPGYWAVPRQREPLLQERRVDREVMASDVLRELPANVSSEPAQTDHGDPALEVVLSIDARKFHFVEEDGLRTQRLVFIATLFDDSGNFVTGTELNVRFALKEPAFIRMTQTGLEMSVTLEAPPGAYRLRGVAQDGVDGKIIASSLRVQIR